MTQLDGKSIHQIVTICGDGILTDGSVTSSEFRAYLSACEPETLRAHAEACLKLTKFDQRGLVLQDIVNQLGARLGFDVDYGLYRGSQAVKGVDGIWTSPTNSTIVVEVKSTDTYRIDLGKLVDYRRHVVQSRGLPSASILIVVGAEDTRGLEEQIRGSTHALEIRLISVEGLLNLLSLRESTDDPRFHERVNAILTPREYIKVDGIIDLVFDTVREIETTAESERPPKSVESGNDHQTAPVAFHKECVDRVAQTLRKQFVKRSRAVYVDDGSSTTIVCAVSKVYSRKTHQGYWFALHPHQLEQLAATASGYMVYGCGSAEKTLLIPSRDIAEWVDELNTTVRNGRMYCHIIIDEIEGHLFLRRKGGRRPREVSQYLLQ